MRASLLVLVLAALPACTTTYVVRQPAAGAPSLMAASPQSKQQGDMRALAARVLVTPSRTIERPSQVVGVLDFHTKEDDQDKGFDQLRIEAAKLGADAVIGAEFEHGQEGELSHLSGMAVRYIQRDERGYTVLGKIDIATAEDAQDKGYTAMEAKAAELGADRVIDVQFEHGQEGGLSHLTGTAVRSNH